MQFTRIALLVLALFMACSSNADAASGLVPGEMIPLGGSLHSPDGRFMLALQPDGNLVWLYGGRVLWHSNTVGTANAECHMQADGNLVIYEVIDGQRTRATWNSGTCTSPGASLQCQPDGNLVIYDMNGQAVWCSGTLAPPREEDTVALSIREIHCEATTLREGALFGTPEDDFYMLLSSANEVHRFPTGDPDVIRFGPGARTRPNYDLCNRVLVDGEQCQISLALQEQEGKIRIDRISTTYQRNGDHEQVTAEALIAIAPDDERIGIVVFEITNIGGEYDVRCHGVENAAVGEGVVTFSGAGAKYHLWLVADHYSGNTLQSIRVH